LVYGVKKTVEKIIEIVALAVQMLVKLMLIAKE
jgi:hypothetical protein